MTDNEIIKALECCLEDIANCDNCPYEHYCNIHQNNMLKDTLELINRQKAEISVLRKLLDKAETEMNNQSENIKKLTEDCCSMQSTLAKMSMGVEEAKAEAIKGFAERLIQKNNKTPFLTNWDINNLVKEMVGDTE